MVWSPSEGILVERIEYDELFTDEMVSKACKFYFNNFLPSAQPFQPVMLFHCIDLRETSVQETDKAQEEGEDVQLLSVSAVNRPSIALQQLGCVRHTVDGDGNCLFYAIAHQAGLIEQGCHGDRSVADQLRTLALICMQKYPDVRVEDGITLCQWEQKKLHIVQHTQWGEI